MWRERVPGPRRARETWECIPGVPSAPLLPQDSGRSRAPNSLSGRLGVEPGSGSGRYSSRAQPPSSRPYSVPAQHALHPQNHSPEGTHCPTPRRPACPTPQSQNSEDAVPGATLHSPRRPTRTETRLAVSRLTTGSRDDQGIQRLTPRKSSGTARHFREAAPRRAKPGDPTGTLPLSREPLRGGGGAGSALTWFQGSAVARLGPRSPRWSPSASAATEPLSPAEEAAEVFDGWRKQAPTADEKAQAQRSDFPSITEPVNDRAGRTKRSLTPPAIINGPHWRPQSVTHPVGSAFKGSPEFSHSSPSGSSSPVWMTAVAPTDCVASTLASTVDFQDHRQVILLKYSSDHVQFSDQLLAGGLGTPEPAADV
ncbi:PREDICTED: nascent polypeptide-associated complex subunit alpha, muscle-specific form [Cercocebus atys]|uniref:nascent polypeptide-associated complex subunit alpha, muscle-specific form n=1 Tax=Cercocebus atys TaxID=9531 RepID=UPI0005F4B011|nr:PREDICTED: nascent polypeptide-associated complex subunit alpha, muscle-specific form [Cercocebus atys]